MHVHKLTKSSKAYYNVKIEVSKTPDGNVGAVCVLDDYLGTDTTMQRFAQWATRNKSKMFLHQDTVHESNQSSTQYAYHRRRSTFDLGRK